MSENKSGNLTIKIQGIKLHPLVAEHEELLASLEYVMKSIKDLTSKSLEWLQILHPVYVVQEHPGEYLVVAGIRTYNIAARVLHASSQIRVRLVDNVTAELMSEAIYADLYLTHLAFSLRHPAKDITDIHRIIPNKYASAFTPDMARNISRLARALGAATSTIYYRRKKVRTHND